MRNFTISTLLTGLLACVGAARPVRGGDVQTQAGGGQERQTSSLRLGGRQGRQGGESLGKSALLVKGKARGKVHAKAHVEPVRHPWARRWGRSTPPTIWR